MGDFLGTGIVSNKLKNFFSYNQAKKILKKKKIKNKTTFDKLKKLKKISSKIPSLPNQIYKKNWKGWNDFLNSNYISPAQIKFKNYNDAKKYALSLKLKGMKYWFSLYRDKKLPINLPRFPDRVYKKEWKGWPDFLGYKRDKSRKPRSKKS